jgi:hypothetical protein
MYCISNQQIDFILNDISARGVKMESLQQDILDHVCCIIEQNLEENGDFEGFYFKTIQTFYKAELKEIEEETISLLTNKHFYTMKKLMIYSGVSSAVLLSLGIILKFLHWPGSAPGIVLGIGMLALIFLPLMFTLKMREKEQTKDKVLIGLGTLSAILMTLSLLFKVMHWPGAMIMGSLTMAILLLLFFPIYLITGLRNPETKINTIVTSVLLVCGCGLWFTLITSPVGVRKNNLRDTAIFFTNETLLKNEQKLVEKQVKPDSANKGLWALSKEITGKCEVIKSFIIKEQTGYDAIDSDFETKNALIDNYKMNPSFEMGAGRGMEDNLIDLKRVVEQYNAKSKIPGVNVQEIPVKLTVLDMDIDRNTLESLNDYTRIEMFVLQNERALTGIK